MQLIVAAILPYLAVIAFFAGVTYRLITWLRLPQPGPMTLFPTRGSAFGQLAKEALLFPSLQRGDRFLWTLAWVFHVSLAVAFVGHLRIVTGLLDSILGGIGLGPGIVGMTATVAGGIAGMVLLLAILGFIVRRVLVRRVREISTVPDFASLLLLTAVIISGNLMRWAGPSSQLSEARTWVASLLALSPTIPTSSSILLHALFAELLIFYVAFSKLMHFGGFFLTFSLTKRTNP